MALIHFSLLTTLAAASAADPCSRLCERDGPSVCTAGSWTKPDGSCHGYLFRGDPALRDVCYHTTATASTCPGNGTPVSAEAARGLLSTTQQPTLPRYPIDDLLVGQYLNQARTSSTTPPAPIIVDFSTPYPIDDLLVGLFLHGNPGQNLRSTANVRNA